MREFYNPGKYYVYVMPGHIKYFDDLHKAIDYAEFYGVQVKEVSTDEVLFDFEDE